MLRLVKIALSKPYTFVVLAILIVLFGGAAAFRTPTDIFPDIKIPVIAAALNRTRAEIHGAGHMEDTDPRSVRHPTGT